jgi:hypothetical protein
MIQHNSVKRGCLMRSVLVTLSIQLISTYSSSRIFTSFSPTAVSVCTCLYAQRIHNSQISNHNYRKNKHSIHSLFITASSLPFNPGCSVITGRVTAKNAVPPLLLENCALEPTWKNAKSPATRWCVTPVASSKTSIWPDKTYFVSSYV